MVDGGADEGKAQGDVHGVAEGGQLHRNEPLVVIAGDDGVELSSLGPDEKAVGRERPRHVDALAPQVRDRGHEDVLLLPAEQAVLARMGIQSAKGDAGGGDAEARELPLDEPRHPADLGGSDGIGHRPERPMDRQERNP